MILKDQTHNFSQPTLEYMMSYRSQKCFYGKQYY